MSPKKPLTVVELVQKFRTQFPEDLRPHLRRRIRTENPGLFKNNPSNLRKLDRHLKKEFDRAIKVSNNLVLKQTNTETPREGIWSSPPDFAFSPNFQEAHRKLREPFEVDMDELPEFPEVPFNWHNFSSYWLRFRLEVRVFLGGKYLGLINDPKGYYNGLALIDLEPSRRMRDGRFMLPNECAGSSDETTIEVTARILDRNDKSKKEYLIVRSWSYDPKKKNWFFEPKSFSDETMFSAELVSSWGSLIKQFGTVGAQPTKISIELDGIWDQDSAKELNHNIVIQGIMMHRGAKTMQTAVKTIIPDEYEAYLFTQAQIEKGIKITWKGKDFKVKEIEEIYDIYKFSYRIAKLVKSFKPGVAWL